MDKLRNKKILVLTTSSGSPGIFSFTRVLRSKGFVIDFWQLYPSAKFNFPSDKSIRIRKNYLTNKIIRLYYLIYALCKYNVFHYYSLACFVHIKFDFFILKLFRKTLCYTFAGSDGYNILNMKNSYPKELSPYNYELKKKPIRYFAKRNAISEYIQKNVKAISLNGPWLAESVKRYDFIIPYSREIKALITRGQFNQNRKKTKNRFVIVHAPTNRKVKGTEIIVKAIDKLKIRYPKIQLVLLENIDRDSLLNACAEANLAIDQVLIGWYGGFAVEMMSLGVPTMAYLKQDFLNIFKNAGFQVSPPIINCSPDNLENSIEAAYKNYRNLTKYKKNGRDFALKIHSPNTIANQFLRLYVKAVE